MKKLIGVLIACAMVLSVAMVVDAKKGGGKGNSKDKACKGQVSEQEKKQEKKQEQKREKKQKGKGSGKGSKSTPYGWSQGKKKGWQGSSYPPGWTKWDEKKKEKWSAERNESEDDINAKLISYNIDVTKRTEILKAYDQAIVGGLAINDASKTMITALRDAKTRRGLMIDTTQSVLDLLR